MRERMSNPYSVCRAWLSADARVRTPRSVQQISDIRRIAAIPAIWGMQLDELGAAYAQLRWVGGADYLPERERRYRVVRDLLLRHASWREWLAASRVQL